MRSTERAESQRKLLKRVILLLSANQTGRSSPLRVLPQLAYRIIPFIHTLEFIEPYAWAFGMERTLFPLERSIFYFTVRLSFFFRFIQAEGYVFRSMRR